ncbi:uncharacterized protein LOC111404654 [Olea europaea var. sylvestris]|uniref:uncharacterized protein LOC111404654 n=1 Tax=Olea europaea var. sylvestris TaxID=158386 RepID=UPI000C1D25C4|nr:uncharacterized protein LOC111404654 [Olea europaea var. sylvestris]
MGADEIFSNGLNGQTRTIVNATVGGILMAKTAEATYSLLDDIATNSYQWSSERSSVMKVVGLHELDPITTLAIQVTSLTNQIVTFTTQENQQKADSVMSASSSHQEIEVAKEQVRYVNSSNYNPRKNFSANHYHLGLRNHENLSYGNNRNMLQPSPRFNTRNSKGKPSLEDILGTFISETRSRFNKDESRLDNIQTHVSNMGSTMKNLEVQIKVNLKEYCKAVVLRSGKQVEEGKLTEESVPTTDNEEEKITAECFGTNAKLRKVYEGGNVKEVEVERKKKDPGSFTIPCTIGSSSFDKALCDLGASINLMPLSVFKKLGLGKVKLTIVTLQLANRSLTYPQGIIEDVIVKVNKFIFPANFVVLDMEED